VLWKYKKAAETFGPPVGPEGIQCWPVFLTTFVYQFLCFSLLAFLLWSVLRGAYARLAEELWYWKIEWNGWLLELLDG